MLPPIILMRHGETVWNRERRMQGQLDSPLTLGGIEQAQICARTIRENVPEPSNLSVFASPLGRCWQTAVIVADSLGINAGTIVHDDRLREITWGRWDGMTADEIERDEPERWQQVVDSHFELPPPGGESIIDVLARAKSFLSGLDGTRPVLVVAHGMFGRAMRCAYLEQPFENIFSMVQDHDVCFELSEGRVLTLGPD